MRSRFRSSQGPNARREGRPLELVRVRGTQRDPGAEGRELKSRRRRGGRGRRRGTRPPQPPRPSPNFWGWLKQLLGATPPRGTPSPAPLGEQERRAIAEFSKHYQIEFRSVELLKLALTHRSYLSVTGEDPLFANERLEFLGDSVLGLVTSEHLYRESPGQHEGQLTKDKSLLVSKAVLARRALAMGLGRFVLMSHSEVESGGRQRLSILADAFESVIGAIYLDQGFEAAREFIERWLLRDADEITADKRHTNHKSHLQEYVQSTFRTHPVYRIRSEMGPDHSKQFMVEVMVGRRILGAGKGRNKKEAEQSAARDALEKVGNRSGASGGRERGAREGRRGSARPGEPTGTGVETDEVPAARAVAEPEDEAPAEGRRRRRGRRGGVGRRSEARADVETPRAGREGTTQRETGRRDTAHHETEDHEIEDHETEHRESEHRETPARPPRGPLPRREARGAEAPGRRREPEPRVQRFVEVEPRPPAYAEDDEEEIGRPEGPLEERHVDPFALESPEPEESWEPAAPEELERPEEPEPKDDLEPEDDPPPVSRPIERPVERGPSFGRRPGRGRRGR